MLIMRFIQTLESGKLPADDEIRLKIENCDLQNAVLVSKNVILCGK